MSIIMHLDMNSYFASVEQQANPFYRGRSVGVCAYLSPGGCIIASSREAKARGIKTGCRVSEALQLDPEVILVENDPDKYRSTTEQIFKIINSYSEVFEPYSIDEAFVDLTGYVSDFQSAYVLALVIQDRIKQEVGEWLDCSVGLATTRFLAKFAGDLAPKRGILILDNNTAVDKLIAGRALIEAWGLGAGWQRRLNNIGIETLDQLKAYDSLKLKRYFGRPGYYLWANLNGIELDQIHTEPRLAKSIGHSYCLPQWTKDKDYLAKALYKLCEKTGRRLRASAQEATHISLFAAYQRSGGVHRAYKVVQALFSTAEIWQEAEIFLTESKLMLPISMLAVSVSALMPLSSQLSLFDNKSKRRQLSLALDHINDRYGEYTVIAGAMWGTTTMARDRIGFRKSVTINY